ncbi:MAG TPA: alginate lyase family protein [Acidobacteriaceae bacterium]|jgi:hypothetical protein
MTFSRREFCLLSAATLVAAPNRAHAEASETAYELVAHTDRKRILRLAAQWLPAQPDTITAHPSPRTPGGLHDFFSEADYFWPNPANPSGPYKEIDGKSNPDNFLEHRRVMIRLSQAVPALTAAFLLTGRKDYARAAASHLLAWFVTPATRMNPNLEYSQGVRNGGATGRSYGIIDTLHLVEVARAAPFLRDAMTPAEYAALQGWFREYLGWMKTSKKGITERDATNNHSIAWALQAAEFARLAEDEATRNEIRERFLTVQLPMQMAADGGFPRELARTKPYGYSIFNFDVASALCWSLSSSPLTSKTTDGTGNMSSGIPLKGHGRRPTVSRREEIAADNELGKLIRYTLPDGRGMCKAASFLYPYLKDKSAWPYKQDVQHWESWPVREPGLLFCGLACSKPEYIALWKTLDPDPADPEIIRNFPVRQPLLWVG